MPASKQRSCVPFITSAVTAMIGIRWCWHPLPCLQDEGLLALGAKHSLQLSSSHCRIWQVVSYPSIWKGVTRQHTSSVQKHCIVTPTLNLWLRKDTFESPHRPQNIDQLFNKNSEATSTTASKSFLFQFRYIYPRHLNIHKNQVKFLLLFLQCCDCFSSTGDTGYWCTILKQHRRCNSSIDKVIINLHVFGTCERNSATARLKVMMLASIQERET